MNLCAFILDYKKSTKSKESLLGKVNEYFIYLRTILSGMGFGYRKSLIIRIRAS